MKWKPFLMQCPILYLKRQRKYEREGFCQAVWGCNSHSIMTDTALLWHWETSCSRQLFWLLKMCLRVNKKRSILSMLLKTAHKVFPEKLLGETPFERGECVAFSITKDDIKLQICRFNDLKTKDFISTCISIVPGNPHRTIHSGAIPRPKVAKEYLKYAASIDIHNHYRCGSAALEDVWHTHNPHLHQFSGVLGICFTNAYLAMKYFTRHDIAHREFKCAAALALTSFYTASFHETRSITIHCQAIVSYIL